ncbi:hypothetical protein EDC04DRAFT_2663806 [Pisolithus marmoratus]|nr:hypothetical protein EDC04DRAFT_2663806 [Pisolithus marmoratus]
MECYPDAWGCPPQNNFTGLESKFACVHRFLLFDFDPVRIGWDSRETKEICLAFPNIRHLILSNSDAVVMLHPDVAVHWQHLESLTIHTTAKDSSGFLQDLLLWLKRRFDMNGSTIRLTFKGSMNGPTISSSYEALREICILEWSDVIYRPEVTICGTISSRPWLETLEVSDPFPNFASRSRNTTNIMSVGPFTPRVEHVYVCALCAEYARG